MRELNQRRLMEIVLVDREQVSQLAEALRKLLGDDGEVTASEQEAEVRFSTDKNDAALAALLAKIAGVGVRIAQFREVPMDLEDAFLSVTRRMHGGSGDRPGGDNGGSGSPQTADRAAATAPSSASDSVQAASV